MIKKETILPSGHSADCWRIDAAYLDLKGKKAEALVSLYKSQEAHDCGLAPAQSVKFQWSAEEQKDAWIFEKEEPIMKLMQDAILAHKGFEDAKII